LVGIVVEGAADGTGRALADDIDLHVIPGGG